MVGLISGFILSQLGAYGGIHMAIKIMDLSMPQRPKKLTKNF
jgi:hypothetical protein